MHFMEQGIPADPMALLERRELRGEEIRRLSQRHPERTVVACQLNIPGPIKLNPLIQAAFDLGKDRLLKILPTAEVIWEESLVTGPELVLTTPDPVNAVKAACLRLEETASLGRVLDLDVYQDGRALSREDLGLPQRSCLICGQPARVCARSQAHPLRDLLAVLEKLLLAIPELRDQMGSP